MNLLQIFFSNHEWILYIYFFFHTNRQNLCFQPTPWTSVKSTVCRRQRKPCLNLSGYSREVSDECWAGSLGLGPSFLRLKFLGTVLVPLGQSPKKEPERSETPDSPKHRAVSELFILPQLPTFQDPWHRAKSPHPNAPQRQNWPPPALQDP